MITATLTDASDPLALVVGTFSSVSLDPPLVSFMPMKTSKTFEQLRKAESLCFNLLADDQEDIITAIVRRKEGKLEGLEWTMSTRGNPVLDGSIAVVEGEIANIVDAGDHWIAVCSVRDMEIRAPKAPLLFFQGGYGSFVSSGLLARLEESSPELTSQVERLRATLEHVSKEVGCEVSILKAENRDEMATLISAYGPGISEASGMGNRLPIIPPIGDTYMFAHSADADHWLAKSNHADHGVLELYRGRLEYLRDNGYLLSFLPESSRSTAYDSVHEAVRHYGQNRLTPAQEREIRPSITESDVDYAQRDLIGDERYDIGSLVLPARDLDGEYTLTLRFSQLPSSQLGSTVKQWIDIGLSTVSNIETILVSNDPAADDTAVSGATS